MNINLRAEGFKLKDGVRLALDKKLTVIDEVLPNGNAYDVYIKTTDNGNYKCEIRVQNGKEFIRSEAEGTRIEFAINNAVKLLKKRVYKLKTMKIEKKRKHFAEEATIQLETLDLEIEKEGIKRIKNIEASLMTEVDAILELESLNHSFYIFRNADKDDALCVLYARGIGYGLIVIE